DTIRQMVGREYSEIINRRVGRVLCCINSTYDEKGCGYSPACRQCPVLKMAEKVLDSGQPIRGVEIQPTFKVDNKEIAPWLCISAEPTMIDGRKHAVIAIDDITDRKKAEDKLKETMEIKSQFISTVSHELRTPLGCMKEGIAIVLDGLVGQINDQQRKFLNLAKRNVDRLAVLVNNVLDFQQLEADKIRLDIQANDISEVVEEAYQTMVSSAKNKGIDFSIELEDNLPKARFDSAKIIQVLTNLINNAIKFTPEGGKVYVCAGAQGQDLVMRISDTGMGIPKQDLTKIFDRFYRIHRPGKEIQGTGLGLAIVNKIVTMHGGRIEVESEVDKGTTVIVFLPLAGPPRRVPEILPEKVDETLEKTLAQN
ncbi:MAG: sensor histidine kinase, partial [Phycisphaerae bacterium]